MGRNRQSKGAARPPLQRSSGPGYISTGSGFEQRRQLIMSKGRIFFSLSRNNYLLLRNCKKLTKCFKMCLGSF